MNKAKNRLISNSQLFCLLTVSALTHLFFLRSLQVTAWLTESIVSVLLCFIAYGLQKAMQKKRLTVLRRLAALLLPILAADTVRELLLFAERAAYHEASLAAVLLLSAATAVYAASLRLEAIARFSFLCAVYTALVLTVAVWITIGKTTPRLPALDAAWRPDGYRLLECCSMPATWLLCAENSGSPRGRTLAASVLVPPAVTAVFLVLCTGLLGAAAAVYPYPVFVLYQLCVGKTFSGMDMLYISSALGCVTVKCAVLLYLFRRELLRR